MRRILTICSLAVAAATAHADMLSAFWSRSAASTTVSITGGLQHFWNPGGGYGGTDTVGTLNGTVTGTTSTSTNGWDFGTADGNRVSLSGPISNSTSFAVAAWVKPDVTAMNLNATGGWILSDREGATNLDFTIIYEKASGKYTFVMWYGAASYSVLGPVATNSSWQHLCVVRDQSVPSVNWYLNGTLFSATNGLSGSANNQNRTNTTIGTASWNPSDSATKYHGMIDKVRFYNVIVPSASVVSAIYTTDGRAKGLFP